MQLILVWCSVGYIRYGLVVVSSPDSLWTFGYVCSGGRILWDIYQQSSLWKSNVMFVCIGLFSEFPHSRRKYTQALVTFRYKVKQEPWGEMKGESQSSSSSSRPFPSPSETKHAHSIHMTCHCHCYKKLTQHSYSFSTKNHDTMSSYFYKTRNLRRMILGKDSRGEWRNRREHCCTYLSSPPPPSLTLLGVISYATHFMGKSIKNGEWYFLE